MTTPREMAERLRVAAILQDGKDYVRVDTIDIMHEASALLLSQADALDKRDAMIAVLHESLRTARNDLYNGFEPDNQSRAWHRADEAVRNVTARAEAMVKVVEAARRLTDESAMTPHPMRFQNLRDALALADGEKS